MYQMYMNGYSKCMAALTTAKQKNRRFAKWLEAQCGKTSLSAGNLESLLILPIQRIPRYQLLLQEVIKQTRKAGDEENVDDDLPDLEKAYHLINDITALIDARMEDYDRRKRCQSIEHRFSNLKRGDLVTPSRRFIAESKSRGIRIHHQDGYSVNIVLFLFSDCLIYGHFSEDSWGHQLHYDHSLCFDAVFECVLEDHYKNKHCLKLLSREHSIFVSFRKLRTRTKWSRLIESANAAANKLVITNLRQFRLDDPEEGPAPCYIP